MPTTKFDDCGFIFRKKAYLKDEGNEDIEVETDELELIKPSKQYKNVYAFLDDPEIKPAFYKDYIFRIDETDKMSSRKGGPQYCLSSAAFLTAAAAATTLTLLQ